LEIKNVKQLEGKNDRVIQQTTLQIKRADEVPSISCRNHNRKIIPKSNQSINLFWKDKKLKSIKWEKSYIEYVMICPKKAKNTVMEN
jgi:hypothetical protein